MLDQKLQGGIWARKRFHDDASRRNLLAGSIPERLLGGRKNYIYAIDDPSQESLECIVANALGVLDVPTPTMIA
eukprot:6465925-Amphidinium_carterae.1